MKCGFGGREGVRHYPGVSLAFRDGRLGGARPLYFLRTITLPMEYPAPNEQITPRSPGFMSA